jgi:hypothetical protein
MSSRKLPVAINVFPTLDYIELVQYDDRTGEIEKAASLPCQFDMAGRQVADWEQMGQAIRDLFSMNRIPAGTPAVLVLPSFFTREIDLLAEFSREELRFALISEAERFYVFKKTEPQIDWINLEDGRLLYSAYPKDEIEHYVRIFKEYRIPLVGIELGYCSVLRGLLATGAVQEELENQERWCLLVISDYSFFASVQRGVKPCKSIDTPLSSSEDLAGSIVQEIQQDFESFMSGEDVSKLIVVNNSRRIRTEDLVTGLGLQGNVILIEQNAETLLSRGAQSAQFPCSLEGIGGVFYSSFPEIPRMNFLPEGSENVEGITIYRQQTCKWLSITCAATFLFFMLVWGLMSLLLWQKEQEIQSLSKQIATLTQSAYSGRFVDLNRKRFVKKVLDRNVQVNNLLVRAGRVMPEDTWLEKVEIEASDILKPVSVLMEGKALTLDKVNQMPAQLSEAMSGVELEVSNATLPGAFRTRVVRMRRKQRPRQFCRAFLKGDGVDERIVESAPAGQLASVDQHRHQGVFRS